MRLCTLITVYNRTDEYKHALQSVEGYDSVYIVSNVKVDYDKVIYSDKKEFGAFIADAVRAISSECDVISFLNDDDMFLPNKADRVREVFADERVIFHRHRVLRIKGDKEAMDWAFESGGSKAELFVKNFLNVYNDSSISVRTSFIVKHLDVLSRVRRSVDSTLFTLSVIDDGKIVLDDRVLSLYFIHSGNTSNTRNPKLHADYAHDRKIMIELVRSAKNLNEAEREQMLKVLRKEYLYNLVLSKVPGFIIPLFTLKSRIDSLRKEMWVNTDAYYY